MGSPFPKSTANDNTQGHGGSGYGIRETGFESCSALFRTESRIPNSEFRAARRIPNPARFAGRRIFPMYRDLALGILVPGDSAADRAVDRVRARHPDLSDEAVAGRLVEQAAWRCAAIGAVSCAGMELAGRVITGV